MGSGRDHSRKLLFSHALIHCVTVGHLWEYLMPLFPLGLGAQGLE